VQRPCWANRVGEINHHRPAERKKASDRGSEHHWIRRDAAFLPIRVL